MHLRLLKSKTFLPPSFLDVFVIHAIDLEEFLDYEVLGGFLLCYSLISFVAFVLGTLNQRCVFLIFHHEILLQYLKNSFISYCGFFVFFVVVVVVQEKAFLIFTYFKSQIKSLSWIYTEFIDFK